MGSSQLKPPDLGLFYLLFNQHYVHLSSNQILPSSLDSSIQLLGLNPQLASSNFSKFFPQRYLNHTVKYSHSDNPTFLLPKCALVLNTDKIPDTQNLKRGVFWLMFSVCSWMAPRQDDMVQGCCGGKFFTSWQLGSSQRRSQGERYVLLGPGPTDLPLLTTSLL